MLINYQDVAWNIYYSSAYERYDLLLLLVHIICFLKKKLYTFSRKIFDKSLTLSPISLARSSCRSVDRWYLILVAVWDQTDSMSSVLRLHCSVVWTRSETEAQIQNYHRLLISSSFISQPQSGLNPAFYSALFLTSHEPSSRANLPSDKSIALIGLAGNESHTSLPFFVR